MIKDDAVAVGRIDNLPDLGLVPGGASEEAKQLAAEA